jgi:hypothetical protein
MVKEKTMGFLMSELSWVEIKQLIKRQVQVIIPIGSTEQHSSHLPVGTQVKQPLRSERDCTTG